MSRQNVELTRKWFDAFNRRDFDAMLAMCDQDVEVVPALVGGIENTCYKGLPGYRAWLDQQFELYDEMTFEVQEIRPVGNRVLALYTARVRGKESGVVLEAPWWGVATIESGRIVRQVGYRNRDEALEAVGLRE